jgi:hypothetical protein
MGGFLVATFEPTSKERHANMCGWSAEAQLFRLTTSKNTLTTWNHMIV